MKNNKFLSAAIAAAVAGSLLLGAAEVAKADWDHNRHDNGYHRGDHPRYWHNHRIVERRGYYRGGVWVPGEVSYGYYVGNIWYPYVAAPPPRHGGVDLDINIPIR